MDKDLRKLLLQLEAQGFAWEQRRNNHIAVYRDGQWVTSLASTPSDNRGSKNAMAALKRAGFDPRIDRKGRRR